MPGILSLCLTLMTKSHLRRHPWLSGKSFVITALVINVFTVVIYFLICITFTFMGGMD